jgi:hypothetical protein
LFFFRLKSATVNKGNSPILDEKILKDERWASRVALRYEDSRRSSSLGDDPFRDLALLKQSIKEVTKDMMAETRRASQQNLDLELDDRIGWVMRSIRAIEHGHRGVLLKCIRVCPEIGQMINRYDHNIRAKPVFRNLRDFAVRLHRESLLGEMRDLQRQVDSQNEGELSSRRNEIQVTLNRLKPGRCEAIAAIQGRDGVVISDPVEILNELRHYWGDVFASSSCNDDILNSWIAEELDLPTWGREVGEWLPSEADMMKTIRRSGKSAPGPDGIPYLAWRRLGQLGQDVLFAAAQAMTTGDLHDHLDGTGFEGEIGSNGFNLGNMVFLPKKPTGQHPLFGDFYGLGDVRPLMIVNTDNRILANFYRRKWEPLLDAWISLSQQGFLPGRSMASNIVGVEASAQEVSLKRSRGGILLLDFKAAFPSISQSFLLKMLGHLHLPRQVQNVIKNLYEGHSCNLCFGGMQEPGFQIGAGIRQGCPLSPLLFALVVDIVLRRIKAKVPNVKVFAFADDVALILEDVGRDLGILQGIFDDLEEVAGLVLNKKKCVLIPLWPTEVSRVQAELVRSFPSWADIQVAFSSVYLGVNVGPMGHTDFWTKAIRKFLSRARDWGRVGLGLYFSTLAYSVYILPVLSFLAQFRAPSEEVLRAEEEALRGMVPGPFNWCLTNDLFALATHYGQARSFPSLRHLSLSARARMVLCENSSRGGLQVHQKCIGVSLAARFSNQPPARQHLWGEWYDAGILQQMRDSEAQLGEYGLSSSGLWELARGGTDPGEDRDPRNKMARKCFQKTIRRELVKKLEVNKVARMRFKLERCNLSGFPGLTASRFLCALEVVKANLPPKVGAAVLRTAWNGWCTSRRFQQHGKCVFGCQSLIQEDSIEHYSGCAVGLFFLRQKLRFRDKVDRGHLIVLGANSGNQSDETWCKLALWSFVMYKAFNHLRHRRCRDLSADEVIGLMGQYLGDGVAGHEGASRFLGSCCEA